MTTRLVVISDPTPDHRAAIAIPLAKHNDRHGPPVNFQPVAIALNDAGGNIIGGLWGKILYDWLFVDLLSVPEELRGQDLGTALMTKAEELARARGCVGVWLDTYAFQARGFYEKIGYTVFGQLDDHPKGSTRYFLRKRL